MTPALALAAAVLFVLLGREGVRLKGERSPEAGLALDLQVTVERLDEQGHARLERAEDGVRLTARDGLVFRFGVEGGAQLVLLERDPMHHLRVVFERGELASHVGHWDLDITNAAGKTLRFVPEGPPGDYTLLAVLNREVQPVTPSSLDAWWERYVDQLLRQTPTGPATDQALDAIRIELSSPHSEVPVGSAGDAGEGP